MTGLFITFEGTEGSGKSTQIRLLAERLQGLSRTVRMIREPGGTLIGEEIRHTLQHSQNNQSMTAEAELLLVNASRAQLVREVIRPALGAGEIVICDRFYDSTVAYQGYGRGLNQTEVARIIQFAVGETHPDLTLLLRVPVTLSEVRRTQRQAAESAQRDRMEEAGRDFFLRVEAGYQAIAAANPERVKAIDATRPIPAVAAHIWDWVAPRLNVATSEAHRVSR
jgi:dTMP kinase